MLLLRGFHPAISPAPPFFTQDGLLERLVRQQSWQEIVDESSTREDVASHSGPESCGDAREGVAEALTGETGGSAIEPRNPKFGTPTPLSNAEGNMNRGDMSEPWNGPARSETLHTPGSFLHRSWEISAVPGATTPGSSGKAKSPTPGRPATEKSDAFVVPEKPSNKGVNPARNTADAFSTRESDLGETRIGEAGSVDREGLRRCTREMPCL